MRTIARPEARGPAPACGQWPPLTACCAMKGKSMGIRFGLVEPYREEEAIWNGSVWGLQSGNQHK